MDIHKIIEAAREINDRTGFVTFDQLSELCPNQLEPEDIKALIKALNTEGIQLADNKD